MFEKILVANRGEIACRIIDTAKRMGVRSVAVYSDADARARHVAFADQAVRLGPPAPAESYLRGDLIIEAALATGAEAIHPGYGFLSENPDFVEAVESAGLCFIGPSAKAIRAMGLKDAAKALMEEAGVPVVPGYHGSDQSDDVLAAAADKVGYPVLIKAVAGGGGKGMRRVDRAEDFIEALTSARNEARSAFGNPAVLIEKYILSPRHIEVQVFGDGQDAVHLFERDCSLQRRHQKVIEEAPAPGMTDEVRQAMGDAAVRAARAIGYAGAGTVEFIVDGSQGLRPDGFWFMEMNTRLQVEHPVTEMVTELDLVEWQLRIAAGEPLPMRSEQLRLTGHAFEARLYAEDVPAGFLPATGHLSHLRFPDDARTDTGVQSGDVISPYYDPMIAKLIVHGPTRAIALKRLRAALDDTQVAGCTTNLAFLRALTRHDGFAAGEFDTGLIERDLEALVHAGAVPDHILAQAAMAAAGLLDELPALTGFSLWTPLATTVNLQHDSELLTAQIALAGRDAARIMLPSAEVEAERHADGWRFDGRPAAAWSADGNHFSVFGPHGVTVERLDPLERDQASEAATDLIEAPMPGLVCALFVQAGDTVSVGQRLAVIEAMKMEHSLTAKREGVVAELLVAENHQVEAGAALIRLEPEAD